MKYALAVLLLGLACCGPILAQDKAARNKKSAELLKEFGEDYKIFTTRHWILVYKADLEWVKSCGAMLERTHDTFVASFEKAGFISSSTTQVVFPDPDGPCIQTFCVDPFWNTEPEKCGLNLRPAGPL